MASSQAFAEFHQKYGLQQCIKCHGPISEVHHLYCNGCHKYNQLDIFAKQIDDSWRAAKSLYTTKTI